MNENRLSFRARLPEYQTQADELFHAWKAGDPAAIRLVHSNHPRFLDDRILWLPKKLTDTELRNSLFAPADAQLALARWYGFRDWAALGEYAGAVTQDGSSVCRFETAVEAVINGDTAGMSTLLRENPELVNARSTRITPHDPPVHRCTLLHYIGANGVEGYRQKTPANAVEIAKLLLDSGAEVDALADVYGGRHTTMSMVVSSVHPAKAGLQVALVEILLDYGAAVDGRGSGAWTSPLMTALVFGYQNAAQALVRRGAKVDRVAAAAGLGRIERVRELLGTASAEDRHRALAFAAQLGHTEVVRVLLDAGEDPNRYNPEGTHRHSTPLHQAALAGHEEVVQLLVSRGARLDIRDTIYEGTPLGWALHAGRKEVADYLRAQGAGT